MQMGNSGIKSTLEAAKARSEIVRVYRDGLEDGWADGFVVALGDEFFAIELIDKAQRLDGFSCLRYKDVSDCMAPAPNFDFVEKALQARGEVRSSLVIDPTSLPALLRSAAEAFPLLTIFFEEDDSVCYIGKFVGVTESAVSLLEILPNACWDSVPTSHSLSGVTRVDFGGAYEASLQLVAPSS